MAWRRISWRACKGGAGLCLSFVHLVLICLALLLGGIIASIHLVGTVPVPGFIATLLRERFAQEGIDLSWDAAECDLIGRIFLHDLICAEAETGHPLLRAEFVRIDLDLSGTLGRKRFTPEDFFVRDAELFLPPELAADGGEQASLRVDEAGGRFRWDQLQLNHLLARGGQVRLAARGIVPLTGLGAEDTPGTVQSAIDVWRATATRLAGPLETLQRLPALSAHLEFTVDGESHWLATAHLLVPEWSIQGVHARHILLVLPEIDLRTRTLSRPAQATIEEIRGAAEALPTLHEAEIYLRGAPIQHPSGWRLPGTLWVFAQPRKSDLPDTALALKVPLYPLPQQLHGAGQLSFGSSRLEARFTLGMAEYDGTVELTWQGDPDVLLDSPLIAEGAIGEATRFSSHTRLECVLRLSPGWNFTQGRLHLNAFGSGVREADFDEAFTHAWFTPEALQVGPIRAFDVDGQSAEGYYLQDFTTKDYRIVAEGAIYPRRLDSLLPKFYRGLWDEIDPGPNIVAADVDVLSRWGDPASTHSLVYARGQQLAYLGLPVDRLTLHLSQATGFVDIQTLDIDSPRGPLTGSIGITFPIKAAPEKPTLRILDLSAQVPLADLGVVFGPDIAKLEDDLSFTQAPAIDIRGLVTVFPDKTTKKDLHVSVESLAPWALKGVVFDRVQAELHLDGSVVHLQPLVAGIGEGRWELAGSLSDPSLEGLHLDLATAVRGIPYATIREVLKAFKTKKEKTIEHGEKEEIVPGLVDLDLKISCAGDPWKHLLGTGSAHIFEADFGRIHLFGGLSRAFSSVGLNLTSFKLDQLNTQLQFEPGRLVLPDLEVRGPSMRLDTPGTLTLPETELDFRTKVFFLNTENPTLRGLLGGLLSPLSYVFELRIRGTLDDPKWNLVNSPLNLFRKEEKEKEKSENEEGAMEAEGSLAESAEAVEITPVDPELSRP